MAWSDVLSDRFSHKGARTSRESLVPSASTAKKMTQRPRLMYTLETVTAATTTPAIRSQMCAMVVWKVMARKVTVLISKLEVATTAVDAVKYMTFALRVKTVG